MNDVEEVEREERSTDAPRGELAIARDTARVAQEVQAAIIVAQRFPRNEDEARVRLLKSCKRPMFADEAEYEFPRGGNDVSGASVVLAREAARVWGNIQYGFEVIAEDEVWRSIRAYAWDVETNSKVFQEDRFKKLIYRKREGWIKPDERDLRELTNRRAAICYRNCILQLFPRDIIDEAIMEARKTLKNRAAADPDGERKRVMDAFADLNIMPSVLEQVLGHPLAESSPAEIAKLRGIYRSIRDGNSNIGEYLNQSVATQDANLAGKSGLDGIKARHQGGEGKQAENPSTAPQPQPETTAPSNTQPASTTDSFDAKAGADKILDHQRQQHGRGRGRDQGRQQSFTEPSQGDSRGGN